MENEYLNNKINGKFNDNNINLEKTTYKKKSHFYLNKINKMKHKYLLEKANQALIDIKNLKIVRVFLIN